MLSIKLANPQRTLFSGEITFMNVNVGENFELF